MHCAVVFFLTALLCSAVNGKSRVLFANVTGIRNNAKVEAACANDDFGDAIAWITPLRSEFTPTSANEWLRYIQFNWRSAQWAEEFAYKAMFGPVTDYTWELLPTLMTKRAPIRKSYNFKEMGTLHILNQFELNFSFLGKSNAQIYMCNGSYIESSACVVIILGGWNGEGSILRQCSVGTAPIAYTDARNACQNLLEKVQHSLFFSEHRWSQISVQYYKQILQVTIDDTLVLIYNANHSEEFNCYTKLYVHSYTENALWKYHEYKYFEARLHDKKKTFLDSEWFVATSNLLCVSFLSNFYKEIHLELFDHSYNVVATSHYQGDRSSTWRYASFNASISANNQYLLRIHFDPDDIVALRNIVIHEMCEESALSQWHLSSLTYQVGQIPQLGCTSLKNPNDALSLQKATSSKQARCETASDFQCNVCTSLYNSTECSHRITCTESGCICSPGFVGDLCERECDSGWYGYNCGSKCGECKDISDCHPATGICLGGCWENHVGTRCNERYYPVLLNISSVQTECVNSCRITLYDNSLNYDGRLHPKYYYTRLFLPNQSVAFGLLRSTEEKYVHFDNLTKSAIYTYEVILCVTNNATTCYSNNLPRFTFETKCEELSPHQIQIVSVDKVTTISVSAFNSTNQCDLSEYAVVIRNRKNETVITTNLQASSNVHFKTLQAYTDYTLELLRDGKTSHNIEFRTDEDVPYAVGNANVNFTSATKLSVFWKEPTPIVGVITHYLVEWKWFDKRDCSIGIAGKHAHYAVNVTTPSVELSNLQSYSVYYIAVYAFTQKGRGAISELKAFTNPEDIDITETLTCETRVFPSYAIVRLNIDCANWNGPFFMLLSAICRSDWCNGDQKDVTAFIRYTNLTAMLDNLLPYTNYSLNIHINQKQKQQWMNSKLLTSLDIKTQPSAPNRIPFVDVYSLSATSLSLRWSASYPPTGILDSFVLVYEYFSYWRHSYMTNQINIYECHCELWADMFCATLTDLADDTMYTISIAARNEGVNRNGAVTSLKELTRVRPPDPPLHLEAFWESRVLFLRWQHPNRTYGPLTQFHVVVNGKRLTYNVDKLNFTYTLKTTLQCRPNNHNANVTLQTVNSQYSSAMLNATFSCPVFTPKFHQSPMLTDIFNNTITVTIPKIEDSETISTLYILLFVYQPGEKSNCEGTHLHNLELFLPLHDNQACSIIGQYEQAQYAQIEGNELRVPFTHLKNFNPAVDAYDVGILLVNEFAGEFAHSWNKLAVDATRKSDSNVTPSADGGFIFGWLVVGLAIAIIAATIVALCRTQPAWLSKVCFSPARGDHCNEEGKQPDVIPLTSPVKSASRVPEVEVSDKVHSCNVPVPALDGYVKQAIENGELQKQHATFKRGLVEPAECGRIPTNYPKNRYKNLIAYDHTRVKLQCNNGKPTSDYINANYIKSPICEKAYIATQGPTDATVYDFWSMILDEGVQYVIMLANLIENGKPKVSLYWPDHKHAIKMQILDDIEVHNIGVKTFYTYEERSFAVKRNNTINEVIQLHFTNWPDHGVPLYPESLMPFVMRILEIPHSSAHPILVHCSAGVGRTGTMILIDILLRQAQLTQHVDAFHELDLLRSQRANLVDNVEQYKLVHLVLLEYFTPLRTTFSCDEYAAFYAGLDDATLENLLAFIDGSTWQESAICAEPCYAVQVDLAKNRDPDVIPCAYGVLYLRPQVGNDSTYINAVTVDGFNAPKRFIATQHPLANTVDDFWRLVCEQEVHLIISLQPTYDVDFWKNGGDFLTANATSVEHIEALESPDLHVHTLSVTVKGKRKAELKMIEAIGWGVDQTSPTKIPSLLSIWREVNNFKLGDSTILVMCRNGATGCGLYIALNNLLDRIQAEQVVNVCKCVRMIRRSRKQFVTSVEQMKTLHRLAALLLSEFEIYSNFTPTTTESPQPLTLT